MNNKTKYLYKKDILEAIKPNLRKPSHHFMIIVILSHKYRKI